MIEPRLPGIRGPRLLGLVVLCIGLLASPVSAAGDDAFDTARALEREGAARQALPLYREVAERAPDDPRADAALFHLARIQERELGALEAALRSYRELIDRFPDSRWSHSARGRVDDLVRMLAEGPETRARHDDILRRHTLGEIDRETARREFEDLVAADPGSHVVPGALLWIAEAERRLGRPERAHLRYEQLLREFPDRPEAREARRGLGDLAFQRFDHATAIAHYERLFPARSALEALNLDRLMRRAEGHLARQRWLWLALGYLGVFTATCLYRSLRAGTLCSGARASLRELALLAPGLAVIAALAFPNIVILYFIGAFGLASAGLGALGVANLQAGPMGPLTRRIYPPLAALATFCAAYAALYWLDLAFVLEIRWG